MKYIVTGAAGFIGSHICDRLIKDGNTVIAIDDLSSGTLDNLYIHEDNPRFTFLQCDILNFHALVNNLDLFKGTNAVFHLAAFARIQPSIPNPKQCHDINVNGTFNILEIMRLAKIDKIIYSASSSSYGLKNKLPLKETQEADCLNPYAVSKYIGEQLCKTWGKIYGIKNICLKYFNVYGPRSPIGLGAYSPVIGLFLEQANKGLPLTIVGDGKQKRDMTYISDVVEANIKAANFLENNIGGQTINIGTGKNYTVLQIANKIKKLFDKDLSSEDEPEIELKHIPARPGESKETKACISLANVLLKWRPKVDLDTALETMYNNTYRRF